MAWTTSAEVPPSPQSLLAQAILHVIDDPDLNFGEAYDRAKADLGITGNLSIFAVSDLAKDEPGVDGCVVDFEDGWHGRVQVSVTDMC